MDSIAPSWEDIQQLRMQWQELNAKEDQLRDNIDNIILECNEQNNYGTCTIELQQQEDDERAEIQEMDQSGLLPSLKDNISQGYCHPRNMVPCIRRQVMMKISMRINYLAHSQRGRTKTKRSEV